MKKLWHSLKSIIYAYVIQLLVCLLAIILYIVFANPEIETLNYDLIFQYIIIGITVTIIPMIIYILKKYSRKESKVNYKQLLLMVPLGWGLSWFYNMLTINLQEPNELMNLHIIIIVLYTVILGPIFEEMVFRYVAQRHAEEVYSKKVAVITIAVAFALLHTGLIGMLYAFIIGLILGRVYQKEKNIIYPITIHISANLASLFVTGYNTIFLIIGIVLLGLVYYLNKRIN